MNLTKPNSYHSAFDMHAVVDSWSACMIRHACNYSACSHETSQIGKIFCDLACKRIGGRLYIHLLKITWSILLQVHGKSEKVSHACMGCFSQAPLAELTLHCNSKPLFICRPNSNLKRLLARYLTACDFVHQN